MKYFAKMVDFRIIICFMLVQPKMKLFKYWRVTDLIWSRPKKWKRKKEYGRERCCLDAKRSLWLDIIEMINNCAPTLIDISKVAPRTILKRHGERSQSTIYSKPPV